MLCHLGEEETCREALSIARNRHDAELEMWSLARLANHQNGRGLFEEAETYFERALSLCTGAGLRPEYAWTYFALSHVE